VIPHQRGLLFVFSGPSAAGKNTIMKEVLKREPSLQQLPTATTRPIRADEMQGREHEFISEAEFRQRILKKQLIEWQIIHDKGIYGVPRATVQEAIRAGRKMILDVDVLGAMQLKQEFGNHLVLVFIEAPDMATLETRLRNRSDYSGEEDLQARLRRADFEMQFQHEYDHILTNRDGQLEDVVQTMVDIVHLHCTEAAPLSSSTLGWNPDDIQEMVTGIVIQNGYALLQNDLFPHVDIAPGEDSLPFDVIRETLESELGVAILPTRPDAIFRKVEDSFEPPQLVRSNQEGNIVEKDFIYILQPSELLTQLPEGYVWFPIDELLLENPLGNLVKEAALVAHVE
jgi:guanylate kinase